MSRTCQSHNDMMRKALEERGLSRFISENDEEMNQKMVASAEGKVIEGFDSLIGLDMTILIKAMEALGLYILSEPTCPLCEVLDAHDSHPCSHGCSREDVEARWIELGADAVLEHVRAIPDLRSQLTIH